MFPSTLLLPLTAAFAGLTTSTPIVHQRQLEIPENWNWHVTGWHAGCARSGCSYNFNVTIPTIENKILGVKAYCSGAEVIDGVNLDLNTYRNCQILEGVNNGVSAKFGPRKDFQSGGPEKIFVSFTLGAYEAEGRPEYNFTGNAEAIYNAFVAPLREFDVVPTVVWTSG
ncbi:hypothetical protein B0J11DRAFT_578828 [Dendryphion nanum]|uniref:Uncharacterized protein n=1 Tax=Dendryphion nanum TaxID=256645 RepID=A0A9P9IRL2_9PLEO|nr:hypothetical protein B0J11DRAFT_578828 [Dendryphion nanum]